MEAHLSTAEDYLVGELSLSLGKTASYVKQRRQVTSHSAVPSASHTGVQVVRVNVASATEWMDPQSVMLSFNVQNTGTQPLEFASTAPHIMFSRCEVRLGGVLIEDLQHFNRISETFYQLQSAEKRLNTAAYGFGTVAEADSNLWRSSKHKAVKIAAGASKRVCMTFPLSGILGSSTKWIPLWAVSGAGLEILLTLADPVTCTVAGTGPAQSSTYQLNTIALHSDLCTLDSAITEKYMQGLSNGDALLIHTKTWSANELFLAPSADGSFEATLSKPLSRLATVFINVTDTLSEDDRKNGKLLCNTFTMYSQAKETVQAQLQVGSKRFPEYPVQGAVEAWFNLQGALGVRASLAHSLNVDYESFVDNAFTLGFDVEAVPQAAASGVNTQSGLDLRIAIKGMTDGAGKVPNRAFLMTHADCIAEIRAGSVMKLD